MNGWTFLEVLIGGAALIGVVGYLYERIIRATAETTAATREIWRGEHGSTQRLIDAYERLDAVRVAEFTRMAQDANDQSRSAHKAAAEIIAKNNAMLATFQQQAEEARSEFLESQQRLTRDVARLVVLGMKSDGAVSAESIRELEDAVSDPKPREQPKPPDRDVERTRGAALIGA